MADDVRQVEGADDLAALARHVQELRDREELRELVARYGPAVDDQDWEALAELFTPDAVFDAAVGRVEGREAVIDYYEMRTADYVASYHYPHSQAVTFTASDEARGVVCAHAELGLAGRTMMVALRYHDRYRRTGGRWRFQERDTRILYVLPLSELATGLTERDRIRWPGADPAEAQLGADVLRRNVNPHPDVDPHPDVNS